MPLAGPSTEMLELPRAPICRAMRTPWETALHYNGVRTRLALNLDYAN
jgi:hypothetical protein